MAIMSILAGLSVPAVKGLSGSNGLNTGTRKLADWMNLARSEAITRHTLVRFAVARVWNSQNDAVLRKISLWAWNADVEQFLPLTAWEELPVGVVVEPVLPNYVSTAAYATEDRASVNGDCVLDDRLKAQAEFDAGTATDPVLARYIEFLPSGGVRIPGSTKRNAIFVATQGFANAGGQLTYTTRAGANPATWAQINVDTLTGRVRVYRP